MPLLRRAGLTALICAALTLTLLTPSAALATPAPTSSAAEETQRLIQRVSELFHTAGLSVSTEDLNTLATLLYGLPLPAPHRPQPTTTTPQSVPSTASDEGGTSPTPDNRTPADAAGSGTPSGPQPPSVAPGSSSSPVFDPFAITTPSGPSFGAVDTEWLAAHAADLSLGDDPGPTLPPTEYGAIINRSFTSPINAGAQVRGGAATDLGFLACPVAGPTSFIDSWGFPRSRGRSHKGADMFSPRHTPVVAVASGVITRVDRVDNYIVGTGRGDLGGKTLWLRDDSGHGYYYAHLEDISENIRPGVRVVQGQLLGTVGNSGNARTTPPHLHFQIHPHSGPATNPYPYLKPACPQN